MKYAYLDKSGILHITLSKKTAEEYAKFNGKIKETNIEAKNGYPFLEGHQIIVYSAESMKIDANDKKGIDSEMYPELKSLYESLN